MKGYQTKDATGECKQTTAPRCVVIAGPNGSGKTTFARDFLPTEARIFHFVNADLLAAGLSPIKPEIAALAAGKLMLRGGLNADGRISFPSTVQLLILGRYTIIPLQN